MQLVDPEIVETLQCTPITLEEAPEMKKIGEEMIEYCLELGGIGLAAPQVGIGKQMFVWRNTDSTFEIVMNPRFLASEKKKTNVVEACLSYPGSQFFVVRAKRIRAMYQKYDEKNNKLVDFSKLLSFDKAIIFQHETSHLIFNEELGKNMTVAVTGIEIGKNNNGS